MTEPPMVRAERLVKTFGDTRALDGLDLTVERGEIVGVLGPNGAGKTTALSILSTLERPDSGRAEVAGFDVLTHPADVRARIALTGQYAAVDEKLTARENLVLFARLLGRRPADARARARELLDEFDLTEAADRRVETYSGGMRRRADIAVSLVGAPSLLFLDEPTTGLDPRSRLGMWERVRALRDGGMTVLLTTQYLEEADMLADRVVVVDHGRVIAEGTPDALKDKVGGTQCEVRPLAATEVEDAARALSALATPFVRDGVLSLPAPRGAEDLTEAVRLLDAAGIRVADIALRRPTLDDVFLRLTGHPA
ncbi:daunorubicin resistance protein DrrA family ABC transporter ATP-binding protein [Pseudonocardia acaciae]|uniref:daunorubicin resistance protein DrrA family ABC transporter ATP-binding protein n=1 Tax=Pseudonocardia acaciae TaxID=551276 RepID=UPI000491B984|nr:daunorubicin resistance protein DrrA family ABC transporter ATP-binding protein [Pseudonocardia acaciae]